MGEGDFDGGLGIFVGDDDSGAESGGEALLAVGVEGRPEGGDVAGFVGDGFDREVTDGQRGGFAFELRKLGAELTKAVVERRVEFLELLHADAPGDVEVVELLHFRTHTIALRADGGGALVVFCDFGFGAVEMRRNLRGVGEIVGDAADENLLQHCCADFVFALRAGVVRAARIDIHLAAAAAFQEAGENVHRLLAGLSHGLGLLLNDCGNTVEHFRTHDGRTLGGSPFAFGLHLFSPASVLRDAEDIRAIQPLRAGATEHPIHMHVGELLPAARAVSFRVEQPRDDALAPVSQEKLERLASHRSLGGHEREVLVFPLVAVGREAIERPAEFGAHTDG